MNNAPSGHDQLLICIDSPLPLSDAFWTRVASELESRIGIPTTMLNSSKLNSTVPNSEMRATPALPPRSSDESSAESWEGIWQAAIAIDCRRLIVCFVGESTHFVDLIRSSLAWRASAANGDALPQNVPRNAPDIFFAPNWDAGDWAEVLMDTGHRMTTATNPDGLSDDDLVWDTKGESELVLVVDAPSQADPIAEDRYATAAPGERVRRAEAAEVVWELRRRGLRADFRFSPSPSASEARDSDFDQVTQPPRWGERSGDELSPTPLPLVRIEIPWSKSMHRGGSGQEPKVQLSVAPTESRTGYKARLSLDRVVHVASLGTVLISKALLAMEKPPVQPPDESDLSHPRLSGYETFLGQMRSMIPSHYRLNESPIDPSSMGSAQIDSDSFGVVRWGEVWTTFCAFGLAGGPPHRGQLLVPEQLEDAHASPAPIEQALRDEQYLQVQAEIRRGIFEVSCLETEPSAHYGWLGVRCESEAMAGWMLLAMVAENVMARREGPILYVPLGRAFRVRKEVKNVIAAVAKTFYYWRQYHRDHLFS